MQLNFTAGPMPIVEGETPGILMQENSSVSCVEIFVRFVTQSYKWCHFLKGDNYRTGVCL